MTFHLTTCKLFSEASEMALNKFMHPRNPYKTPPNFKELAIQYPNFRKVVTQDLAGKIHLDFSNQEAVRALTETLFLRDFKLEVKIPENTLVPTLPSRLNYLLWIEDLLSLLPDHKDIFGIDIGAGASAVYPLLAAQHFNWRMIATESDKDNFNAAKDNVTRNKLDHKVTLVESGKNGIFEQMLKNDSFTEVFDFSMCNPPFYSQAKLLSDDQTVGSEAEMKTKGGEVEFVKTMISESEDNSKRVRVFTVLLGHKSSLSPLKQHLTSTSVTSFVSTEFCQGKTMRWGLAWTFLSNIDLKQVFNAKTMKDKQKPFTVTIDKPESIPHNDYGAQAFYHRIKSWLESIHVELIDRKSSRLSCTATIRAKERTWQNQRRLKREGKRKRNNNENEERAVKKLATEAEEGKYSEGKGASETCSKDTNLEEELIQEMLSSNKKSVQNDELVDADKDRDSLKVGQDQASVLECSLLVKWAGGKVVMEVSYLEGEAGRDGVHQLCQFVKNKFSLIP